MELLFMLAIFYNLGRNNLLVNKKDSYRTYRLHKIIYKLMEMTYRIQNFFLSNDIQQQIKVIKTKLNNALRDTQIGKEKNKY